MVSQIQFLSILILNHCIFFTQYRLKQKQTTNNFVVKKNVSIIFSQVYILFFSVFLYFHSSVTILLLYILVLDNSICKEYLFIGPIIYFLLRWAKFTTCVIFIAKILIFLLYKKYRQHVSNNKLIWQWSRICLI